MTPKRLCDVCNRCPGGVQRGISPEFAVHRLASHRVTIGTYAGSWFVCEEHMHKLVEVDSRDLKGMVISISVLPVKDGDEERDIATIRGRV